MDKNCIGEKKIVAMQCQCLPVSEALMVSESVVKCVKQTTFGTNVCTYRSQENYNDKSIRDKNYFVGWLNSKASCTLGIAIFIFLLVQYKMVKL